MSTDQPNEQPNEQRNIHLLEQVEKGYLRQENLKNTLEEKANRIIATSGIITTLIFAFINLASSNATLENTDKIQSLLIIMSVVTSISAIILSIITLRVKKHAFVFGHNQQSSQSINDMVNEYRRVSTNQLIDDLIDTYVIGIEINSNQNMKKAAFVKIAEFALLSSILLIGVSIIITSYGIFY